ncbi:sugar ABC transporter substrate-binding protein [Methylovirgula sp. 4M-Z18]|uniref:ABC transporter substrate-binding protein n=1 Tax=Methylovirgula sp. 4M-Z18 TaxID=2293567 RepID=UPI001FE07D71|nr:sugar ABC transporter substrate-binding protein [Methylovirgula sp. 4M-Z18]
MLAFAATAHAETTLTIATVNNGDMIRMQKLTDEFTKANPDIKVNWVTMEENQLRQKVTTDIATKAGQYDILTIGTYEVPIWAKKGWLVPLDQLGANYDVDDIIPAIRSGLSVDGKLYAAPFYGESSMIMYRKDLFAKAGLTMPEQPTWDFIKDAAAKITDKKGEVYGICLRGKAGWGENGAFLTTMANSYGARWFDEKWQPEFNGPEWKKTLTTYVDMMNQSGPPGASSNGFNENLALFQSGKCGMWIDATVAASFVTGKESKVADQVGFAAAPCGDTCKNSHWLWAWSLGIPSGSKKVEAAEKFVAWATSKDYTNLVASKEGWANVPPGTRLSLYKNADYLKAAPFAAETIKAIESADPSMNGNSKPKPYVGVQFAAIPEFQGIGTEVGQQFAAALAGQESVSDALAKAQDIATRAMTKAGYIK